MNDAILKLLKERYFLSTETCWDDIAKRVSNLYPEIYEDIRDMNFIPSSPTLMNANTGGLRKGTLSSCFPMGIEDSIDGIFDALKECAKVTQAGGGIGLDYSKLRSSNEVIKTLDNRKSSGPLPFISMFNEMLDGVNQSGSRRGAGAALLDIHHEDILNFIDAKKDLTKFNRFNFSVKVTDEFYKQLKERPSSPHIVKEVVTGKEKELKDKDGNIITVKQLWDIIIDSAWSNAEPGLFHSSIATERCTVTNISNQVLMNPCLAADTLIAVADGRGSVSIKQLTDEAKDVPVYTLNQQGTIIIKPFINPRLTQKQADLYEVTFDSGLKIKCTLNHKFLTTKGDMVALDNLYVGSSIKSITKRKDKNKKSSYYNYFSSNGKTVPEHRIIAEYKIGRSLNKEEVVHHINRNSLDNRLENLQIMHHQAHSKLHGQDKLGKNNPVFRIKDRQAWLEKLQILSHGETNKNYSGITNDKIVEMIKEASKHTLYNLFCYKLYIDLGLPLLNTHEIQDKYRFDNPKDYCDLAGVRYIPGSIYHKLEIHYANLIQNNLDFFFDEEKLSFFVNRKCEFCGKEFIVDYEHRHSTYCSQSCHNKDTQKPFMFEDSKFSDKYINHPNTKSRLNKTYSIVLAYKEEGKNYINFRRDYKGANTVIRNNNIFCPSLEYLKININNINSIEDLISLAEKNIMKYKNKKELSKAIGDSFNHKIVSIEFYGKEDVYDATVDETHNFFIGGREFVNSGGKNCTEYIICSNCSEFTGISFQACSLGSIDLSRLVENKKFNWDKFEQLIIKATRFLNNTLDVNIFPLDKIKEMNMKTRPIGAGYMGLATALFKKEIPYNSDKAIKFTEEVTKYYTLRSMKESVELAKEYPDKDNGLVNLAGSYSAFDYDLFMKANERFFKHKHCRNIDIEQLKEDIKKYGVRNSCFTSLAPTGTLSYLANCSGGLEPVFALSYSRKIEKQDKQYEVVYLADPIFEEYLNKTFDETMKIKILKEVADNKGSCQKCKDIPEEFRKIFITAGDLTPKEHLDILEVVANSVSLSASKTINTPEDIKKEELSKIFLEAHERGIIGVTCYRENSRSGILIHNNEIKKDSEIIEHHAPKRPSVLDSDVHRITYKGEKWISFVGLLNNKPFEIFCGKVDEVNLSKHIDKGQVIKVGSGHYSFSFEDEILIKDINKTFNNEEHDAFARTISMSLRHGTPLQFVCDTLTKSKGDITTFSKVLARILKTYIKDGTNTSLICSNCGEKMRYESGCAVCSCGASRCG